MRSIAGWAAVLALAFTGAGWAEQGRTMIASDAWSRPTPKGLPTGVVYVTLTNRGRSADRLVGATTPVAARMELHRSSMRNGIMSMDPVPDGVGIPAGGRLQIAPGGYHLMLIGLKTGLAAGTRFPATLTFAHAAALPIVVQVRAGPPAMAGMTMR